jgi:hypothetical protein
MRRLAITTAAVLAAVSLLLLGSLPSPPARAESEGGVDANVRARTVAGAYHVHSIRSDGTGDIDAIAAAAGRAGLRFVVMTDHGDATRPPDPPAYRRGVLVIDAVEISTNGGHYAALDMPAAPYPFGGEAAAVAEDVARLGGFGVVTHPDSRKAALRWRDWSVDVDGLEWINLDSEWRDEGRARLARVPFDYMVRPAPALASMLDRPVATLERWDALGATRRLVALPAHDAHGGVLEGEARGGLTRLLRLASYESSFRALAMRVILAAPPSGSAEADARAVLAAMRAGRVFSAIDAVASPAFADFRATSGGQEAVMGEELPFVAGATLTFRSTVPSGGRAVLLRDGVPQVAESSAGTLRKTADGPGVYRVEVSAPAAPGSPAVPWLVTNPIYLRSAGETAKAPSAQSAPVVVATVDDPGQVEKDSRSTATLRSTADTRVLEYALKAGERASQYAAFAVPMPRVSAAFDAIAFTGRASGPMRVSVQLRFNDLGGSRWTHSVYLSPEPRAIVVPMSRLLPADGGSSTPEVASASSILFVVDLTNASPGQSGRFEISDLVLTK